MFNKKSRIIKYLPKILLLKGRINKGQKKRLVFMNYNNIVRFYKTKQSLYTTNH